MTAPYMLIAIVSRTITSILCGAVLLLILFQLRHDARSRAFAGLAAVVLGNTASALVLRLYSLSGGPLEALFAVIVVFTSAIPVMIYLFVTAHFDLQTPFHRFVARGYTIFILIIGLFAAFGALNYDIHVQPDGSITYGKTVWAYVGLVIGLFGSMLGVYTAWKQTRHSSQASAAFDKRIAIGVTVISFGGIAIAIPPISAYTIEQIACALGIVILAGPVLRQRLFDPLTQLNNQLQRRTEQLSAITAVGQQATSILSRDELLQAVAREVYQAFSSYSLAIYLPEDKRLILRAAAGSAIDTFAPHVDRSQSEELDMLPIGQIRMPLLAARDTSTDDRLLVGVLVVRNNLAEPLSQDDADIFQILANQLAIALRNAELFEQAQQANQYKTRFIHITSHELRAPLQNLIGYLDFLDAPTEYPGVLLTNTYLHDLGMVKLSAHHLRALLDGILDLAKIEAGRIELEISAVDPVPLLQNVCNEFAHQVHPGVTLHRAFPTDLPPVAADDIRLKQILVNLLSNACKFTQQGTITVGAEVQDSGLRFVVSDTGPGIPLDAQARLFSTFTQASRFISREYGGVGLGLSISRQLARLHGGDIWFVSREGEGSAFFCSVPLAQGASVVRERVRVAYIPFSDKPSVLPIQVLVIGLELDRQDYLHHANGSATHRVLAIEDTQKAYQIALAVVPDAIICVSSEQITQHQSFVEKLRSSPELAASRIAIAPMFTWRETLAELVTERQ
jgi:signal transduction histidine kinase